MTDQEMQKIIERLKDDPEVGLQVRELLSARKLPTIPETKLEIDPGLVRQVKQLVALYGGGTFRQQVDAQINSYAAGCVPIFMVLGGIIGFFLIVWLAIAIAGLSWSHPTRNSERAYASPDPTVRVLRALPAKP